MTGEEASMIFEELKAEFIKDAMNLKLELQVMTHALRARYIEEQVRLLAIVKESEMPDDVRVKATAFLEATITPEKAVRWLEAQAVAN